MLPVRRTFFFRKVYRVRDYLANSIFKFASRDFYRLVTLVIYLFYTLRLYTVIAVYANKAKTILVKRKLIYIRLLLLGSILISIFRKFNRFIRAITLRYFNTLLIRNLRLILLD